MNANAVMLFKQKDVHLSLPFIAAPRSIVPLGLLALGSVGKEASECVYYALLVGRWDRASPPTPPRIEARPVDPDRREAVVPNLNV